MARCWEYRQEAFAEFCLDETLLPPWCPPHLAGMGKELNLSRYRFASEQDWLNSFGAEGWELVAIEPHSLWGYVGTYAPMGGGAAGRWEGGIKGKRWTFKREVFA